MDIAEAILIDHGEQRRLFAVLHDIASDDTNALAAVWGRLASFLEAHARAEELYFYPELLRIGRGAADSATAMDETKDAIKDHNQIRDAVAEVAKHAVGSPEWRAAVTKADQVNSDHMAEEERQGLADFRQHADLELRHALAVRYLAFQATHLQGLKAANEDPAAYVRDHTS